jgi:predicted Zn-dependent peptidase
VTQEVFLHTYANGLTLLAERMGHVRSAAVNFLVPAGCVFDPPRHLGLATVLSSLIIRGAGSRDSRELMLALDNLGLDRSESVGQLHLRFWGATLADNLPAALELYADILRRPHFPAEEMDAVKALALQDLQGLADEPRSLALIELRRRHYPPPLGRDRHGTPEGIGRLTAETIRAHHGRFFQPRGLIVSVAGNIDWEPLREQVGRLFGDWEPGPEPTIKFGDAPGGTKHLSKETEQTQIAVAYPSVPFGHEGYYAAQGAVQVLSGGMSARLFTEVREKRGLCYSVWASYQTFKDRGSVLAYAGTQNEQAPETLAVLLGELQGLSRGITEEEVERVQAGLKASLIMQQESTSARAGALASDWYYLGRVRSLDEIQAAVSALTPKRILDHVHRYPAKDFTLVTLGPRPIRPARLGAGRRSARAPGRSAAGR